MLAWEYHLLYFELKDLSYEQQRAFIKEHKVQYSSFGMQALLMEMIPVVGSLFVFTNAVGAALFAVHLEEEEQTNRSGTPLLIVSLTKALPPPSFRAISRNSSDQCVTVSPICP
ncbi:hypothetical protein PsorP6_017235 [Peronosclerospora sorghi]|uniref:Uncharacterized protein n=1 Tax=Peronosclerospora sorghi TaxID=230839 RepID=A0ACC0WNA1_9STRA|nr:hypothetical protein PsorP6_017235 [Peronosclerospora sorghi]